MAVKKLSATSKQGLSEFVSEINTIATVRHQNLVQLIGCCVERTDRILVYEYLENSSLDRALLGISKKARSLAEKLLSLATYSNFSFFVRLRHKSCKNKT